MGAPAVRIDAWLDTPPIPGCQLRTTRNGRTYKPKRQAGCQRAIATLARAQAPREPIKVACHLKAIFVFAVPQSWSASQKTRALSGRLLPTSTRTGDLDNLAKLLLDGLEDAGWLANDALVVELDARKLYGERPGYMVSLRPIP